MASVRYRCLLPLLGLREAGIPSVVLAGDDDIADFTRLRALVFVKTFSAHDLDLAKRAAAHGVPVLIDLCDNIFVPEYGGEAGPSLRKNFAALAELASGVVTTGPAMAECIAAQGIARDRIHIANDQVETREMVRKLIGSPDWRADPHRVRTGSTALTQPKRPKLLKRIRRSASESLERLQAGVGDALSAGRKTVVWFGNSGAAHGKYGLAALQDILGDVAAANTLVPLRLLVVTDDRSRVQSTLAGQPYPVVFRRWGLLSVFDDIARADVCVLPNSADAFSATKSANRIVLSLSLGVPVVTSRVRSAEPFAGSVALDDWRGGLLRYLRDGHGAEDVRAGQAVIAAEFSSASVAAAWQAALEDAQSQRRPS